MKLATRKGAKIALARQSIEAYNTSDWDRLRKVLAPNVAYEEIGTQRRIEGAEGVIRAVQAWKNAASDGKGTVRNALASGDNVAIEVVWTGTHTGTLETPKGAIPASGKTWNVPGCQVVRIEDGRIRELRQYFDLLTLLQQIGAAPV